MKRNEASIFLFVASIIIGLLISMNISFDNKDKVIYLDAKQYQEAYNERNTLYKEIDDLTEKYKETENKMESYLLLDKGKTVVTNKITSEIDDNNFLLGLTPVTGQGIKISLKDAEISDTSNPFEVHDKLIHDFDLYKLVNDLKNAGAEAISVNGQRVLSTTEFYCVGPFIRINQVSQAVPFTISAIGDKEILKQHMFQLDSKYKDLEDRYINISLEESNDILIPAYYHSPPHTFYKDKIN